MSRSLIVYSGDSRDVWSHPIAEAFSFAELPADANAITVTPHAELSQPVVFRVDFPDKDAANAMPGDQVTVGTSDEKLASVQGEFVASRRVEEDLLITVRSKNQLYQIRNPSWIKTDNINSARLSIVQPTAGLHGVHVQCKTSAVTVTPSHAIRFLHDEKTAPISTVFAVSTKYPLALDRLSFAEEQPTVSSRAAPRAYMSEAVQYTRMAAAPPQSQESDALTNPTLLYPVFSDRVANLVPGQLQSFQMPTRGHPGMFALGAYGTWFLSSAGSIDDSFISVNGVLLSEKPPQLPSGEITVSTSSDPGIVLTGRYDAWNSLGNKMIPLSGSPLVQISTRRVDGKNTRIEREQTVYYNQWFQIKSTSRFPFDVVIALLPGNSAKLKSGVPTRRDVKITSVAPASVPQHLRRVGSLYMMFSNADQDREFEVKFEQEM